MQTHFTPLQLQDPAIAHADGILHSCVHCGFCTATCPTYVLLGDERDSPRGRISMIKTMLETGAPATADTALHIDRCLSCLSCMSTCPSGVNYMHLIDHARAHVEATYRRPLWERMLRATLAITMPRPGLFRMASTLARLGKPFTGLLEKMGARRLASLLRLVPAVLPSETLGLPGTYPAEGTRRGRVALLRGCVQSVLDPGINAATIRLLTRLGFDLIVSEGESCCGSLPHHIGKEQDALSRARRTIEQWTSADVDHIIITASGCGTTVKDYGHLFAEDPTMRDKARAVAAKAFDITEFLATLDLPQGRQSLRVTYHSACSLQHGQQVKAAPQELLRRAGFTVADVPEGHLCCGSAGTYNILQPAIATPLRDRKLAHIASTQPDVIAAGNIGCMTQLATGTTTPLVHTIELLDWAYGGPKPAKLK
jgi:glycolate oxidase iron-sulfur subunit